MSREKEVIAWRVVFEDASVELYSAEDINGEPAIGRWVPRWLRAAIRLTSILTLTKSKSPPGSA